MRRCLVMLYGVLSSGCFSMVYDAQAGAVSSTRFTEGRYGGAVQLAAGGNLSDRSKSVEHFGPGLDLRGKFTGDIKQVSFGPHVYLISSSWITPYARTGATLVELGSVDGSGTFGALGPHGEVGMFFGPFVISTFAEYDLRWTSQDNEGFVGVMAGIGNAVSSQSVRDFVQQH
jgi:hypothetical protein